MLDRLFKKLHFIFIVAIMSIITLILFIVGNSFANEKIEEQTDDFMTIERVLTDQLDEDNPSVENNMQAYEDSYPVLCLLYDSDWNILYQGKVSFPTDTQYLLETSEGGIELSEIQSDTGVTQFITPQNGILNINGTSNDSYLRIDAEIVSKENHRYHLIMFYQQKNKIEIIMEKLPLYVMVWLASMCGVMIITYFLLKKALKPTERVLKSQKNFIASASHELKSPLAVILANADTISSESTDSPQIQKAVKAVDSECMRMSKLIKDMLTLASSDSKTWNLNKEKMNVDTLLISLYEAYESLCIKNNISLLLDLSESKYPTLDTDKECIFQILSIYMDNAIAHAKNNTSIEIQAAFNAKTITFYVADHGQGVTDESKPYVFNRFYCVDAAHTDKSHFGLGLSIADELAKLLDGKVGLKDTDGGGATFFVTLPIK